MFRIPQLRLIRSAPTKKIAGFSLIEVLVALLVVSIGLVGLAALHLTSLKSAHSSYYRSIASALTLDLEERLWERAAVELTNPGQCLANDDLEAVRTDLLNLWRIDFGENNEPPAGNRAGIPNLRVIFGDPVITSESRPQIEEANPGTWTERWMDMSVSVFWQEARFDAEEADQTERFDYAVRMPCVSEFTPPPPP
jgi:prepilin-type N-terminal cleavage/methylation domain-containing protein